MRELVLLESNRPHPRRVPHAGALSIGLHGGLILLAIWATAQPIALPKIPESRLIYVAPRPAEQPSLPAAAAPSEPRTASARPAAVAPAAVPAAVSAIVPDVIPLVSMPLLDPTAAPLPAASHAGVTGSADETLGGPAWRGAYALEEVEIPATALANQSGPDYPDAARRAGLAGRVRVQFVVGANGRTAGTPEIVFATSPVFEASVRRYLQRARYRPARLGGQPVPQLVEQEFVFELRQ